MVFLKVGKGIGKRDIIIMKLWVADLSIYPPIYTPCPPPDRPKRRDERGDNGSTRVQKKVKMCPLHHPNRSEITFGVKHSTPLRDRKMVVFGLNLAIRYGSYGPEWGKSMKLEGGLKTG